MHALTQRRSNAPQNHDSVPKSAVDVAANV
ncbi:MAG: hypothetical protein ACI9VR_003493, partial [Cognaticolwellia sp.]